MGSGQVDHLDPGATRPGLEPAPIERGCRDRCRRPQRGDRIMTPEGIALQVATRPRRTTPLSLGMVLYAGIHLGALGVLVAPGPLGTGLAILAATYLPRAFGLGAGYHRYFAHRSFRT